MKKDKKKTEETSSPSALDTVIVGANFAGRYIAKIVKDQFPQSDLIIFESGLCPSEGTPTFTFSKESTRNDLVGYANPLEQVKIRWDREWKHPDQVDWSSKDWLSVLPQWQELFKTPIYPVLEDKFKDTGIPIKYSSPVSRLEYDEMNAEFPWRLQVGPKIIQAKTVFWAAGVQAFQNAFEKIPSQQFNLANPLFNEAAIDLRASLNLSWAFKTPLLKENFELNCLYALPVRHESKLLLTFAYFMVSENQNIFCTQTLFPNDWLADPKGLLSFEKSVRRTLRHFFEELSLDSTLLSPEKSHEKRAVSSTGTAGILGDRALLEAQNSKYKGLYFVGTDSSLGGDSPFVIDRAIKSVNQLNLMRADGGDHATLPMEEASSTASVLLV